MNERIRTTVIPVRGDMPRRGRPAAAATYAFDVDGLHQVRELVRRCARGVLGSREGDLVLAVNELATNSVLHGDGRGVLQVWTTDEHVVCEVTGNGHLSDLVAGRQKPALDAISGRGLWMVNQLCDLVETRSGPAGTSTRVRMRVASVAAA